MLNRKTESEISKEILSSTMYSFDKIIDTTVNYSYNRTSSDQNNITIPIGTSFANAISLIYIFNIASLSVVSYKSSDSGMLCWGFNVSDVYGNGPYATSYGSSDPRSFSNIVFWEELPIRFSDTNLGKSDVVTNV